MSFSLTPTSGTDPWSVSPISALSMPSAEAKVDQLEREAYEEAKHLPVEKQAEYRASVRRDIAKIRSVIAEMRSQGRTEYSINRVIDGLFQDFYHSKTDFFEKSKQYESKKEQFLDRNKAIGASLSQTVSKFSPIKRVITDEDEELASPHKNDKKKNREEMEKNLKKLAENATLDKAVRPIGGDQTVKTYKKGSVIAKIFETEGENPIRDTICNRIVDIVIADMAAIYFPTLPAYATVLGSHVVAGFANEGLFALQELEQHPTWEKLRKFDYCLPGESISLESSMMLSKFILYALQVPSKIIKRTEKKLLSASKKGLDYCGITDESGKEAIRALGRNSPENLEEQMWCRIRESVQKQRADRDSESVKKSSKY